MTDRDQRMQALQVENAELKSLLTSFLERTNAGGSAQSSGEAQAGDGLQGLGGSESTRPLGVACGFSERGRETFNGLLLSQELSKALGSLLEPIDHIFL